jgi:hypothetical protein
MTHPVLRREDVAAIVGEIEPQVVEQVIRTGATIDEIALAVAEIEDERCFDDHRSTSPSSRVAMVRALLEPLLTDREGNVSRGRD